MPNLINLAGKRYGRIVVIARDGTAKSEAAWLCQCDCGNHKRINGAAIRAGLTTSCGC